MEDNKEFVFEENTENVVEQPTEEVVEPEKVYTEDDFNRKLDEILPKKLNRKEAKIRREYEEKYGELENILKQGLKVDTLEEATSNLKKFYEKSGIEFTPMKSTNLNDRDAQYLGERDAQELIETSSIEEINDEIKNLVNKGYENLSKQEKTMFMQLDSYVKDEKSKKELAAIGIGEEELNNSDFKDFISKLNPNMSMKDKYDMYKQYRPNKPKVEPMGSMKGTTSKESGVKDFYTFEEANQFTREDLDKNPELFKAIEKSMSKWK